MALSTALRTSTGDVLKVEICGQIGSCVPSLFGSANGLGKAMRIWKRMRRKELLSQKNKYRSEHRIFHILQQLYDALRPVLSRYFAQQPGLLTLPNLTHDHYDRHFYRLQYFLEPTDKHLV